MIVTKIVRDAADTKNLIETSSNTGYRLRQIETNKIYGHIVVDSIPQRFSYEETDELDPVDELMEENINE